LSLIAWIKTFDISLSNLCSTGLIPPSSNCWCNSLCMLQPDSVLSLISLL
jgi:hypothetical protein